MNAGRATRSGGGATRGAKPRASSRTGAEAFDLAPAGAAAPRSYARLSTRPLHVLIFLLPLIALYEVGSVVYLTSPDGATQTIRAQRLLSDAFAMFGATGLHLPAALAVVVLVTWHLLVRDPWRIRFRVLGWMTVESAAWTLPLVVFGLLMFRSSGESGPADVALAAMAAAPDADPAAGPWPARATIALGAGLYEELLFRMLGLAVVHLVLADLLRAPDRWAKTGAVVLTALAFAVYHDGAAGDPMLLAYFFAAGVYFALVYLWRGFGIVVAVHALYDLLVLVRPFG